MEIGMLEGMETGILENMGANGWKYKECQGHIECMEL